MQKPVEGQRVWLREIKEGDPSGIDPLPRARATILHVDEVEWGVSIVVQVHPDDREERRDDGLREFSLDLDIIEPDSTWD